MEKIASATFDFKMGDLIRSKSNPKIVAVVGMLGNGPNGELAYQLHFDKSKLSGKFFPKADIEKEFEFYRKGTDAKKR